MYLSYFILLKQYHYTFLSLVINCTMSKCFVNSVNFFISSKHLFYLLLVLNSMGELQTHTW